MTKFVMTENSVERPLLLSGDVEPDPYTRNQPSLFVLWAKRVLKTLMWVVFFAWIAIIFLYPGELGNNIVRKLERVSEGTPFGVTGSFFMIFSGPIFVIAFLAIAHLIISDEETFEKKKTSRKPGFRLWTFPVLVDGPFGVVSATEFIGIFLFVVFIIWAVYAYTIRNLALLDAFVIPSSERGIFLMELTGLRMGMIGQLCLALLFLPISRGSVLLRIIDIPFEHATRYHVWLGHLTMVLFTLHGLFYVIAWAAKGNLISELLQWTDFGIANLPGVISLAAGLLLWVTSLYPVRKHFFELFFYTHQLYIVFVVFLALHVGDFLFSIVAGGIFLFILDRFLRFFQSRRIVDVLSAKCLPCETVELVFSKPASLRYNALSFIFLQVRELSWLQWHSFSVSSSPLDGRYHISVLIKALGGWTAKLRDNILSMSSPLPENEPFGQSSPRITASVEGPYGHESPYYLMYENLVLVAGGVGISPFLAILSDILHRLRDGKPCLPRRVMIVWAIKKSNELHLLQSFPMESICPSFSDKLSIEANIYITRESAPSLEEGQNPKIQVSSMCPISSHRMSVLVGTGDNIWSGLYVILSTVGFIILMALVNIFYMNPYGVKKLWLKGLIFVACMVASVVLFGGTVIGLWHIWERKVSADDKGEQGSVNMNGDWINGPVEDKDVSPRKQDTLTVLRYGSRPDFKEIFGATGKKWGHVDVGVMVCGPPTLQTSVAREIRSHSLRRQLHDPIFHFNSHSFEL